MFGSFQATSLLTDPFPGREKNGDGSDRATPLFRSFVIVPPPPPPPSTSVPRRLTARAWSISFFLFLSPLGRWGAVKFLVTEQPPLLNASDREFLPCSHCTASRPPSPVLSLDSFPQVFGNFALPERASHNRRVGGVIFFVSVRVCGGWALLFLVPARSRPAFFRATFPAFADQDV